MTNIANFVTSPLEKAKYKTPSWSQTIDHSYSDLPTMGFISQCHPYAKSATRKIEVAAKIIYKLKIGNGNVSIPAPLIGIVGVINNSKHILEMPEDWDQLGAVKIEEETWNAAANFLVDYSIYILDNFSSIIQAPEINPCADGSIDLVWRTKSARLLLNIKPAGSKIFASYYGDLFGNKQAIKNIIESYALIEHLAFWMKNIA